ncbi:reticulon-like protein B16 [Silene latifolia]|uniref:reticulon-like protein B16 n=1 Tax=Silene latifolia TaxID=37657 RepID=UPI003D776532
MWKEWHLPCGVIVVATVAWLLFERSGLPFLTICSDVMLIMIVWLFFRANYAVITNRQFEELPELVLSEEMVNSAAASFRAKVNSILLMAHDITFGKDFRLFFQVVLALWLFSVVGSVVSFFTLAYIGTIIFVTISALYSRHEKHIDRLAGFVHRRFSRQYTIVDDDYVRRPPQCTSIDKDE